MIVVQNSPRGKQLTAGRSSHLPTLPFAQREPEFLIANDNPNRIVILSDQRESKGLSFSISSARTIALKPSLAVVASNRKSGIRIPRICKKTNGGTQV